MTKGKGCVIIFVPLYEVYFFALFFQWQKDHKLPQNVMKVRRLQREARRTPMVLAGYEFRQEVPK